MNKENVGATAFDHPNDVKPQNYNNFYYGNKVIPHHKHNEAMNVSREKVMNAVNHGK